MKTSSDNSSRFRTLYRVWGPGAGAHLGGVFGEDVVDLTARDPQHWGSLTTVLAQTSPLDQLLIIHAFAPQTWSFAKLDRPPDLAVLHLLPVLDEQEVWAAGVAYIRSREARMLESEQSADLYHRISDAQRSELLFRATPSRVVGPQAAVAIRADAQWSAPETELTLLVAPDLRMVSCTIGIDLSARDIEGWNGNFVDDATSWSSAIGILSQVRQRVPTSCPWQTRRYARSTQAA